MAAVDASTVSWLQVSTFFPNKNLRNEINFEADVKQQALTPSLVSWGEGSHNKPRACAGTRINAPPGFKKDEASSSLSWKQGYIRTNKHRIKASVFDHTIK